MSPALLDKYLSAGQRVIDHLVLLPTGITFSPYPALTYSDRDKFAVRRIVDFYRAQNTDYADFLLAAWKYKHRNALGLPQKTLQEIAVSLHISPKYLITLHALLEGDQNHYGPVAELRSKWLAMPAPSND